MKRSVLFLFLLLAAAPLAASAALENYGTIVTRSGREFYDCRIVRVHPDGVAFTHRDGAAKIAFKDLPEHMRREFKYDPKAEAEYQREQAALRKQEKERQRQREIAMEEQLAEAQMAEASYLATAANVYNPAPPVAPMSPALPGEPALTVGYQSPAWVGTAITGGAFGSGRYRRGYSSWGGYYPYGYGGYGYGYGYPTRGYTYPAYTYPSYSYPSYSYPGYTYPAYTYPSYSYPYGYGYRGGYYSRPSVFGSWNVGHGIRVGVGVSPFGGGIRLFR